MTYEEIYERLNRLCSLGAGAGDSAFNEDDKSWIEALSIQERGEGVRTCSCKNRYFDAAMEIRIILKSRRTLKMSRKYDMRAGDLIWHEGRPYSRISITDVVAEAIIKEHPDAISRFIINEAVANTTAVEKVTKKVAKTEKVSK